MFSSPLAAIPLRCVHPQGFHTFAMQTRLYKRRTERKLTFVTKLLAEVPALEQGTTGKDTFVIV